MKPTIGGKQIIIGKRVTIGAAIGGLGSAVAAIWPQYSQAILALVTPITFVVQVIIANRYGVTS